MDALRTAVVLVLLLALGYGVWVVLNHDSGVEDPPEFEWGAETADAGMGDFGDGPFVPPPANASGDVAISAGPAAPEMAAGSAYGAATSGGDFAASSYGDSSAGPEIPPPPPGFDTASAGDSASAPGFSDPTATDQENGASTYAAAEPPAPTAEGGRFAAEPPVPPKGYPTTEETAPEPPASSSVYGNQTEVGSTKTDVASTNEAAPAPTAALASTSFAEDFAGAKQKAESGEHYEALYALSQHYHSADLSAEERRELLVMLDQLAGSVIYSTEHLLEPVHVVRRGESLKSIADELKVPYKLLQNINAIENPDLLTPGTTLKVVRGPFRAEVNLSGNELTLFLGRLYAGRFPISVGAEPSPAPGEYEVRSKEEGKAYFSGTGASFPADHPSNPYGRFWIDLGNQVCIHGSATAGASSGMGCVSLSPVDAADVYGILSAGSKVTIRR